MDKTFTQFGLWIMPPRSVADELKEIMSIRKNRPHSADTYPQFEPHITLAAVKSDTPISLSAIRESIPTAQRAFPVKFGSVDIGDHYFRSVYVSIQLDEALLDLHKALHEKLGKAPNTPKYPHMSLVYVNDEDAAKGERGKYSEELKERQLIAPASSGGVQLRSSTEKEWIDGFLAAEIWVTSFPNRYPMPPSQITPLQFSSDNFLLAAGGVLFRLAPESNCITPSSSTAPSSFNSTSTTPATYELISNSPIAIDTTLPIPSASNVSPPTIPAEMECRSLDAINRLEICILRDIKTNRYVLPKGRKDVKESLEHAAVRETFEESGFPCELLPCPMSTRAPNPELYTGLKPHTEVASEEPFTLTVKTQWDGSLKLIFWYLMRVLSNSAPRMERTQMPNEDFDSMFVNAREGIEMLTGTEYQNVARSAVELVESAMASTDHRPSFDA